MTSLPDESSATIFVTGATSPLGRRVVRQLSRDGHKVCCLLRTARHERELLSYGMTSVVRGDCERAEVWDAALEGIPLLLHLAPISCVEQPLRAARRRGVPRCVAVSSIRGMSLLPDPVAEGVRRGEAALEASGLDFTILRCSMIYGSREDANIQRLAHWLDRHAWLPLIGGGRARIQPVHIDDVTEAIVRAIALPDGLSRSRLVLAGPASVSWREMVETLADVRGRRIHWVPVPARAAQGAACLLAAASHRYAGLPGTIQRFEEDRVVDITDSQRQLNGWAPLNLREGLERTYAPSVQSPGGPDRHPDGTGR